MNVNPLISVIMNCYNSSLYLKEAIESVINQTYSNWEIIFWDNQSTDESAIIFNSYKDKRLNYFYAERHTTLSTARNLAIEKANGEILAFLDCDDLWMAEKLEEQTPFFVNYQNVGIVYSNFEILLNSSNSSAKSMLTSFSKIRCYPHLPKNIYRVLLGANFIIFSSVLIRKLIYDQVNGFSDKFNHNEDYELLLKCSALSDAVCIKNNALRYRVHDTNSSYSNQEIGYLENRTIFNSLKPDRWVNKAININEARYLIFLLLKSKKIKYLTALFNFNVLKGLVGLISRRIYITFFGINNLNPVYCVLSVYFVATAF